MIMLVQSELGEMGWKDEGGLNLFPNLRLVRKEGRVRDNETHVQR